MNYPKPVGYGARAPEKSTSKAVYSICQHRKQTTLRQLRFLLYNWIHARSLVART